MGFSFDLQTLILGLVQGLCEFLPVSSSGHLALLQNFFGFSDSNNLVAFDLLLHCATVLVILIYFHKSILKIIRDWFGGCFSESHRKKWGWSYGWQIIIATLATGLAGLPLRKVVDEMSSSPLAVGCGLIFTAVVMSFLPVISHKNKKNYSPFIIAIAVGIAQGIAVLPGVSRSGMTIAVGILMGLELAEAFRFSFLLSVPAVLGASLLEFMKLLKTPDAIFLPNGYLWAVIIAFIAGFAALKISRKLVLSEKWPYFGFYCLFIGAMAILLSLEIF